MMGLKGLKPGLNFSIFLIHLMSSILPSYQIYHNFMRPHEALKGKTPAEACGVEVVGDNKWITLIQNAKHQTSINS